MPAGKSSALARPDDEAAPQVVPVPANHHLTSTSKRSAREGPRDPGSAAIGPRAPGLTDAVDDCRRRLPPPPPAGCSLRQAQQSHSFEPEREEQHYKNVMFGVPGAATCMRVPDNEAGPATSGRVERATCGNAENRMLLVDFLLDGYAAGVPGRTQAGPLPRLTWRLHPGCRLGAAKRKTSTGMVLVHGKLS